MPRLQFRDGMGIRDVFGQFLAEAGASYENLVVLDGDLASSTRTNLFAQKYPDRFFNMGVAEQDMIGTAAGLALGGMLPVVSSFAIFLTGKPWEQIRQSICHMDLNVKLVASHAGVTVGPDGASHQALEDVSLMRALPHMTVIVPADGVEARGAFQAALNHYGPVYIRGSREKFPTIMPDDYCFKIGEAPVLAQGTDATVIAAGLMVSRALMAASILEEEGICCRVVNMSTIKPIDRAQIIKAAQETGAIVAAEEHSVLGGLGSAVAEVLGQSCPVPLEMIGVQDRFGASGQSDELLVRYGLTEMDIANKVRKVIERKKGDGKRQEN